MGAGAVNTSLLVRFPRKDQLLGPVAAVSFRVASRIVNSLGAGVPARTASELDAVKVILFCSSGEQFSSLIDALGSATIRWPGKALIFLDCEAMLPAAELFRSRGASVASLRRSSLPARLVVEGQGPALAFCYRIAKDLAMKVIELEGGNVAAFEMALTLGTAALTPLIDQAAVLLRQCGLRDADAARLAAALFEQTAREYARTGRQSWAWYQRSPDASRVLEQLSSIDTPRRRLVEELILFGLEENDRHDETTRAIRAALEAEKTTGG
jgi:hypothetical protein